MPIRVYINPEDVLVNVLALNGRDPDIKTSRMKSGHGEIVISSGAEISDCEAAPAGARRRLHFFPGEPSHSLVSGGSREACSLTANGWNHQRVRSAETPDGGGMKTNSVFTSPRGTSERPRRLKSSGNEECEREQGVFYVDYCS